MELFLTLTYLTLLANTDPSPLSLECNKVIEDFSTSELQQLPKDWKTRHEKHLPIVQKEYLYRVEQDGERKVLHAIFGKETITLVKTITDWDLQSHPIFQWQWKAVKLPKGGDERKLSKNDSAASVYVAWKSSLLFQISTMRYAWSSTLPLGEHVERRLSHDHIIIVESGDKNAQTWQTVQVNLQKHYRDYISKNRANPVGIALTSDADATTSQAEAFYADFRACKLAPVIPSVDK